MSSTPPTADKPASLLPVATAAALVIGLAWRLLVGWDRPLWLDETVTGAIALQPSFAGLVADSLRELTGPVYYWTMWAWVRIAGAGDIALRLPSLICSVAAPLLVLWRGHPDRQVRMVWAAVTALTFMLVFYSNEARSYSFSFLLACAQAIIFRGLMEEPTLRRAAGWVAVSVLLILTHYYTAPLAALQGLAYLGVHRKAAIRTWPAALLLLPLIGWMVFHIPHLLRFAQPGVAWQPVLTGADMIPLTNLIFGMRQASALVIAAALAGLLLHLILAAARRRPLPYSVSDLAIVGASLGSIALILLLGFLRPSFTPRYLVPCLPGFLLGIAICARAYGRRWSWLPLALVLLFLAAGGARLVQRLVTPERDVRMALEWQSASSSLQDAGVRRAAFFWDEAQAVLVEPEFMGRIGGFFFDRARAPVETVPLVLNSRTSSADPTRLLPAILDARRQGQERDGFIWIYSRGPDSAGRAIGNRNPPRLAELARRFDCRDFSSDPGIVVLGCVRRQG